LFAYLAEDSRTEQETWTNLQVIERLDGPIDAATRLDLLKALAQARRLEDNFQVAGHWAFLHAAKLGIASSRETTPESRTVYSTCLPLSTAPEKAAKVLPPW
jgi:hypothetical protein